MQVLDWLNNCMDSGSNTCGLDFDYDMLEEDKQIEEKMNEDANKEEEEKIEKYKKMGRDEKGDKGEKNGAENKREDQEEDITEYPDGKQRRNGQEDQGEDHKEEKDGIQKKSSLHHDILTVLSESGVTFKSVTGR